MLLARGRPGRHCRKQRSVKLNVERYAVVWDAHPVIVFSGRRHRRRLGWYRPSIIFLGGTKANGGEPLTFRVNIPDYVGVEEPVQTNSILRETGSGLLDPGGMTFSSGSSVSISSHGSPAPRGTRREMDCTWRRVGVCRQARRRTCRANGAVDGRIIVEEDGSGGRWRTADEVLRFSDGEEAWRGATCGLGMHSCTITRHTRLSDHQRFLKI